VIAGTSEKLRLILTLRAAQRADFSMLLIATFRTLQEPRV
jgi:hypothetical protein